MTGRFLGVDLGSRRIGLAVGDGETGVASAVGVLTARPTLQENVTAILAAAAEYDVSGIVIGLPLNMDGSEGPAAKAARRMAAVLGRKTPRTLHLQDERLSSFEADQQLKGRELSRKGRKARQDAVAAAVLLRSFFQARRNAD